MEEKEKIDLSNGIPRRVNIYQLRKEIAEDEENNWDPYWNPVTDKKKFRRELARREIWLRQRGESLPPISSLKTKDWLVYCQPKTKPERKKEKNIVRKLLKQYSDSIDSLKILEKIKIFFKVKRIELENNALRFALMCYCMHISSGREHLNGKIFKVQPILEDFEGFDKAQREKLNSLHKKKTAK